MNINEILFYIILIIGIIGSIIGLFGVILMWSVEVSEESKKIILFTLLVIGIMILVCFIHILNDLYTLCPNHICNWTKI